MIVLIQLFVQFLNPLVVLLKLAIDSFYPLVAHPDIISAIMSIKLTYGLFYFSQQSRNFLHYFPFAPFSREALTYLYKFGNNFSFEFQKFPNNLHD